MGTLLKKVIWQLFKRVNRFSECCKDEPYTLERKHQVLPSARRVFPRFHSSWILQDNDYADYAGWKQANIIEVLDWPSQSPDANPIQIVWTLMKLQRSLSLVQAMGNGEYWTPIYHIIHADTSLWLSRYLVTNYVYFNARLFLIMLVTLLFFTL